MLQRSIGIRYMKSEEHKNMKWSKKKKLPP